MTKQRMFRWHWWMAALAIGLALFTTEGATPYPVLVINGAGTVDQHALTQRNGASTSATLALSSWWRSVKQKSDRNQWDIYTDQRLTDHAADDVQPRFNTGATQIAFVSNRDGNNEIYRIDADGANLIRLTAHPADDQTPDWSFDNRTILFVSDRDGNPELYRMGADGTDAVRLTFAPEADLYPSWSPDGEQIAWVRGAGSEAAIWVMNTDGSEARPLSEPLRSAARVRWSPDGTALAFDYDLNHDGTNEAALIQADGTGLRLLSCGPEVLQDLLLSTWLPDGNAVVAWKIIYRRVGGKLVVEATYLKAISISECWQQHEYEWHNEETRWLDVEHTDPWPPSSRVRPLPPFSRLPHLLLSFDGHDVGSAGIWLYQLQLRSDVNTNWFTHWQLTTKDLLLPRLPAGKLYFRGRAKDLADNWEPWPPDEVVHTETTMYSWRLSGSIHDLRGNPLAG